MNETSSCINLLPHTMQPLKKTWQSIANGGAGTTIKLNHSCEVMVCAKCGKVINPWESG